MKSDAASVMISIWDERVGNIEVRLVVQAMVTGKSANDRLKALELAEVVSDFVDTIEIRADLSRAVHDFNDDIVPYEKG